MYHPVDPTQNPWINPPAPAAPPQCHSPIFNNIAKLRLDESSCQSLEDTLEDINIMIDNDVGVDNLPMEDIDKATFMAAPFQMQDVPNNKIKVILGFKGSYYI